MRILARLVLLVVLVAGLALAAAPSATAKAVRSATGTGPFEVWCC